MMAKEHQRGLSARTVRTVVHRALARAELNAARPNGSANRSSGWKTPRWSPGHGRFAGDINFRAPVAYAHGPLASRTRKNHLD